MEKTAIYVDFDNIFGAILGKLGISTNPKDVTTFQLNFLQEVLKNFFRELKRHLYLTYSPLSTFSPVGEEIKKKQHYCLCLKVFAEYENLPLSKMFSPSIQIFLHNSGVVPINPFIAFSKKKENRNSADTALVLSAIEDIVVKRIPAETIIVCTCDIDLYPLLVWLKEHTGKKVYLGGFSRRTSSLYDATMTDEKVLMDKYLEMALKNTISNVENWWFVRKSIAIRDEDLNFIDRLSFVDDERKSELRRKLTLNEQDTHLAFERLCARFGEKVISGLKSWLRRNEYATTGLVIGNWLPKWNLGLDVKQANECLKRLISSGRLEQNAIVFEKFGEDDGIILGKFRRGKDDEH